MIYPLTKTGKRLLCIIILLNNIISLYIFYSDVNVNFFNSFNIFILLDLNLVPVKKKKKHSIKKLLFNVTY